MYGHDYAPPTIKATQPGSPVDSIIPTHAVRPFDDDLLQAYVVSLKHFTTLHRIAIPTPLTSYSLTIPPTKCEPPDVDDRTFLIQLPDHPGLIGETVAELVGASV